MFPLPSMREFRTTLTDDGILHLIFDMPGRSMNVFSNAAIHEVEAFADWLKTSDVRGVVISSGKSSAFCVGADLTELATAYDMIVSSPETKRTSIARSHFAPIGRAFRKLETAGKPVAVAINGLALGGGGEFALASHYRVFADTPRTAFGLPESLVGLFPGAGGTQRLPRYLGIGPSLRILLEGGRLSPREALDQGLADRVVPAGEEVAAAEEWIKSGPVPKQPWDAEGWHVPSKSSVTQEISTTRAAVLAGTQGHYPAPLAILNCIERGLPEMMDRAVDIEIDIFAELIKRPEPRNMIQTLFLGKQEYEKRKKAGSLSSELKSFLQDMEKVIWPTDNPDKKAAMRFAGFDVDWDRHPCPFPSASDALWIDNPKTELEKSAAGILAKLALAALPYSNNFSASDQMVSDYLATLRLGFPAYLGGPFALLSYLSESNARVLARQWELD